MVILGSMDRKTSFNVSAEGFQFILSMFSFLILKLKYLSATSFGLYFAIEEYRADKGDTRVSFIRNSREFHMKRVSYFAKKGPCSRNFVFRETGFSMQKSVLYVSYFAKQNI